MNGNHAASEHSFEGVSIMGGNKASSEHYFSTQAITREAAMALIAASREASREIGIEVAIAIVDPAGNLKAFERTDDSSFLASDIAIDKAWTAVTFGLGTHQWVDVLADRNAAQLAHRPRLVAAGGGYPIKVGGKLIGGLGISGGNYAQDQKACEVALAQLGFDVA
ncbi:MAG TPA: heme-binding protein [Burkholderiaceae bacterium]